MEYTKALELVIILLLVWDLILNISLIAIAIIIVKERLTNGKKIKENS